jgi:hypothetical protein
MASPIFSPLFGRILTDVFEFFFQLRPMPDDMVEALHQPDGKAE